MLNKTAFVLVLILVLVFVFVFVFVFMFVFVFVQHNVARTVCILHEGVRMVVLNQTAFSRNGCKNGQEKISEAAP